MQVLRGLKKIYPKGTKIGHFGTLDPFASGLLLVGIGQGTRLNDIVHQYLPKTYLAVGKLMVATATGDHTSEIIETDSAIGSDQRAKQWSSQQIELLLQSHFVGKYQQVPHVYSACKFAGRSLHRWARAGVTITKDPVERTIYTLEVVRFSFPYLSLRVAVSSGTYLRTLFSDAAKILGTCGHLLGLVREKIGPCHFRQVGSINPCQLLPFAQGILPEHRLVAFNNGLSTSQEVVPVVQPATIPGPYLWLRASDGRLLGLVKANAAGDQWQTVINCR